MNGYTPQSFNSQAPILTLSFRSPTDSAPDKLLPDMLPASVTVAKGQVLLNRFESPELPPLIGPPPLGWVLIYALAGGAARGATLLADPKKKKIADD